MCSRAAVKLPRRAAVADRNRDRRCWRYRMGIAKNGGTAAIEYEKCGRAARPLSNAYEATRDRAARSGVEYEW